MNATKIERLTSQVEHESFEYGMTELVYAPSSTVANNLRELERVSLRPDTGKHLSLIHTYGNPMCPRKHKHLSLLHIET